MLKTSEKKVAKPMIPFLIIGLLGAYIKRPILFFLTTVLSFPHFKKRIDIDLPKDFINSTALMAWIYIRLSKSMSQEKAFEITRAAILCTGLAVQQGSFKVVEEVRSFDNLKKYHKITSNEGSTRLNDLEIIESSDDRYVFKIKTCMFYNLFLHLGVPELTKIMCSIDNAIFNTYMPEELIFHRDSLANRIVDGRKECLFIIENKAQEQTVNH